MASGDRHFLYEVEIGSGLMAVIVLVLTMLVFFKACL